MEASLDRASPIPLYHQIAEILRYRIATARLRSGERLPAVREAAKIWDVNLHTVRRAYQELEVAGLIEIRPPQAARVIGPDPLLEHRTQRLDRFLDSVLRKASDEHDLAPEALANLLVEHASLKPERRERVHMLECSELQAASHAQELRSHWHVDALPWSLERPGEPPSGPLVATYFHYNDIRVRWPHRMAEVRFAGIRPDPGIRSRVPQPRNGRRLTLRLCELSLPLAESVAADLSQILEPSRYRIVPGVVAHPSARLGSDGRGPLLFPPRVWNRLSEEERGNPRAVEVRYVFEPAELEAIGRHFGWRRRKS